MEDNSFTRKFVPAAQSLQVREKGMVVNMKYLILIPIIMICVVIWSKLAERSLRKTIIFNLRNNWGQTPEEEYTSEKLGSIKAYYESVKNDQLDVDDITWNDLDMNEIYMEMNNTQCAIGSEYLYSLLRKPCFVQEELEERDRLIHFFGEHEEERIQVQRRLYSVGKLSKISVYDYINRLEKQKTVSNLKHYAMAFGLILSIITIFISPGIGGVATFLFVIFNISTYFVEKAKIENYLNIFSYIFRLLDQVKSLYKLDIPELSKYTESLKEDSQKFKKFRRGANLLAPSSATGNIIEMIFDYLRMLFHIDLIKYNSSLKFFKGNRKVLIHMYENIGFLDSMIAAASFKEMLGFYCTPKLSKVEKPFLSVTGMYHPLLSEPVTNSISENRSVLLTGSNASGKSTFIKTLAINAILAQTIYTSTSHSYEASYFMIYSSMALRDNIFSNESYYIVEIKSLKRILDRVNDKIPALCFIDEVLRGTNTLERIAASSRILSSLAKQNTLVFAATHDIELTHILENDYSNYHFQERIEENQIIFDYKLYAGKAISKNAIKLLGMLGYPPAITTAAESAAEEFLAHGEWSLCD